MTLPQKLPRKISSGLGLSLIDRAVKERFAKRGGEDLQTAIRYFTEAGILHCIYCGKPDPDRWDHLYPVTKGGDTVIGNLVPACGRCDDSKQHKTLEEWVHSRAKYRPSEEQFEVIQSKLRDYQSKYPYPFRPFEEKLSQEERDMYRRFQRSLAQLRGILKEMRVTP